MLGGGGGRHKLCCVDVWAAWCARGSPSAGQRAATFVSHAAPHQRRWSVVLARSCPAAAWAHRCAELQPPLILWGQGGWPSGHLVTPHCGRSSKEHRSGSCPLTAPGSAVLRGCLPARRLRRPDAPLPLPSPRPAEWGSGVRGGLWYNHAGPTRTRACASVQPPPPPRPRVPHLQHPTQAFGAAVAARPQALMHALIHFGVLLARCCCQRFCVRAGSHARAVTVGWCTLARPEQRAEQRNAPGGGGRDARAASATAVHQPATCAGLAAPRAASQQRAVGRRVAKASCGGPRSCAHESRGRGSMPHTHAHSCPVGGFGAIHMRHACERGTNHQHHAPRGLTPLTLGQLVGGVRRAQCSLPAAAAHRRAPWGRLEQRDLGALRRARTGGLSVCLV